MEFTRETVSGWDRELQQEGGVVVRDKRKCIVDS
jgi:hypothetical protein